MIYVTQGDIESIGLEVFFKSLFMIPTIDLKKLILVADKEVLKQHLNTLNYNFKFEGDLLTLSKSIMVKVIDIGSKDNSAFESFKYCIKTVGKKSVLFTLPMSKSNFKESNLMYGGHTDFFRKNFTNYNPLMFFINGPEKICLLTDHIPVAKLSNALKKDLFLELMSKVVEVIEKNNHLINITNIYLCGLNPHAGENGLLGLEESFWDESIRDINSKTSISLNGPIPADTVHKHINNLSKSLVVYPYHDQGLCSFKPRNDVLGINLTLGLPFIRLSVDHGTAREIWGKGIANPSGCLYALLKAIEYERILND